MDAPLKNTGHEWFALARAKGMSAAAAYREAGYRAKDSDAKGSRMAVVGSIVARVAWLQRQAESATLLKIAEKRQICASIARAGSKDSDRLKAIEVDNDLGGDGAEAALQITIRRAWQT